MLTEHQNLKLNQSLHILSQGDRLLVKGSAGTGKTFMINELIRQLIVHCKGTIACTAPTNKAVSVLQNKISIKDKINFMSTHAALKMKRFVNEETGDIYFKPDYTKRFPPLGGISYLIVDEASMVSKEMLGYIEEWATKQKCKIVFLGDEKQLPPVNEINTPVFDKNYPCVELLEIIRQKGGNPIINLSFNLDLLKSYQDNLIKKETEIDVPIGYVFSKDFNKIIERLVMSNGTDLYKYIGYTNEEVNKVNSIVRNRLYGNTPQKVEIGETMVFDAPYKPDYSTNEEITIHKVVVLTKDFSYTKEDKIPLKYYLINAEGGEGLWIGGVRILHEDSEEDFKSIKREIKDKIKKGELTWVDYYDFIEQFAHLKYNHAITCHKSQGSTYQNVIINISDMRKCRGKEYKNLLYTGITRASKMVVLYNA